MSDSISSAEIKDSLTELGREVRATREDVAQLKSTAVNNENRGADVDAAIISAANALAIHTDRITRLEESLKIVRGLVFGIVGLVLTGVFGALIALVIKQ